LVDGNCYIAGEFHSTNKLLQCNPEGNATGWGHGTYVALCFSCFLSASHFSLNVTYRVGQIKLASLHFCL